MNLTFNSSIPRHQWLISCAICLLCAGLVMVMSASLAVSENKFGTAFHYITRHTAYIIIAIILSQISYRVPMEIWQRLSPYLFFCAIALLVSVLIFGREINGSTRWLSLGVINFQPSEIAKIFIIIFLASFIVRKNKEISEHWSGVVKSFVVLFSPIVLLLLEPDFGSVIVLTVAAFAMIFMGGVPLKYFVLTVVICLVLFALLLVTKDYRMDRFTGYLHPWKNQFGSGYQLTQSLIAYGRGEWFGLGLGNSVQKLFYLPEAHTDFLFSVLAEEFGLLGVGIIISLFSILILASLSIARASELEGKQFSSILAYGLSVLMGIQFLFNIGVTMGLLPTKGLTLPLMSYGGSSLLSSCIVLSILLRIDKETRLIVQNKISLRKKSAPKNKKRKANLKLKTDQVGLVS